MVWMWTEPRFLLSRRLNPWEEDILDTSNLLCWYNKTDMFVRLPSQNIWLNYTYIIVIINQQDREWIIVGNDNTVL